MLFDFDGVLADTEPVHFACWAEVLKPLGIEIDWEFYRDQCVGIPDGVMAERFGVGSPECELKRTLFRARLERHPPFLPATLDLVKDLHSTYALAVVSSSHRSEVEPPIERAGIRPCFHAMVCGLEAARLKPAPDPYLKAAELLGARRPLVIEDSDAGVASGRAAGFDVLRVSVPEALSRELTAMLR